MKKSSIIYILALVMIVTLSVALTYTHPADASTPIDTILVPTSSAATQNTTIPFEVSTISSFSPSNSTFSYATGDSNVTATWGGTYSANPGGGKWCILKVTFYKAGTFSYITYTQTYYTDKGMFATFLKEYSKADYYRQYCAGDPYAEYTADQIVTSVVVDSNKKNQDTKKNVENSEIVISESDLITHDHMTLYIAFQSYNYESSTKEGTDSITFSNMSLTYDKPADVTVKYSATDGTVTATKSDNSTLVSDSKIDFGSTINLTANPTNGQKFYYWSLNGSFYSAEQTISNYTVLADSNFVAVMHEEVAEADAQAKVIVDAVTIYYTSLKNALDETTTDKATIMVLPKTGGVTLDSDATLNVGVTLLVPFNDAGDSSADGTGSTATWTKPNTYRYSLLTINEGVTLTINGTLVVGATYGSTSGPQGIISGYYGEIINNGVIELNGTADIYGLITGNGKYNANSGSTTTVTFVFIDFEGGTNTATYQNSGVFPFSQYSLQNIWCEQIINAGAVVKGRASIYASESYNKTTVNLVANSGEALLLLSKGYFTINYNETRYLNITNNNNLTYFGLMTIDVHGEAVAGHITLKISFSGSTIDIDSADYTFVVPYTFRINIASDGKFTIPCDRKFAILPGAELNIDNGGEFVIDYKDESAKKSENGTLYVLDGLKLLLKSSEKHYPTAEELRNFGYNSSATFKVNGKLSINGTFAGIIQTEGNTGCFSIGENATLGVSGYQLGSVCKYVLIKKSGNDNRVQMDMGARICRNSISTETTDSFYTLTNDVDRGKTYYALAKVGSNTIKTTLTNVTLTQYERVEEISNSSTEKLDIAVNSTVTGTFYEKDSSGNYIVPVDVCVGNSDGTISTNANGYVQIINSANTGNLQFASGKLGVQTLYITLDNEGNAPVTYYTTDSSGKQIGPDGTQTAYFDGTGIVMLTHVVKSAELNPNARLGDNSVQNDIIYIGSYDKDGTFTYDNTALSGKWLFYGGESQSWDSPKGWSNLIDTTTAPTISGGTDTTFVSGKVALALNGVNFTTNVYQFTQAMSEYQYNCSQLSTKSKDSIVTEAQTLYDSWQTINANKTDAEKSFIVYRLGSCNNYFGIYKQLSVASNSVSYGDTTTTATATTIDGKTVNGVNVNVSEFTATDGLKATISGTYTVDGYTFTLSSQITVKRREITVTIVGGSKTYDGVAVVLNYLEITITNALDSDKANLISTIQEKLKCSSTVKNAGTYTITADFEGNTYYHATINVGTYVITPLPVSVTIDNQTSVYGNPLASLTVSPVSGLIDGDSIYDYITLTKADGNNVGTYNIVGTDSNANDNYDVTFTNTGNKATYTITARPLTVKVSVSNNLIYGDKITYGNSDLSNAAVTVTLVGVISADNDAIYNAIKFTINGDTAYTAISGSELNNLMLNAGNYSLTASVTSSNYKVSYDYGETSATSCSFTIERRRLNVSFNDTSSTYGETIKTSADLYQCIVVTYTDNSQYEGEQPFDLTAVDSSKTALTTKSYVGVYDVLISNTTPNYMISVNSGDVTTEDCVVSGVYRITQRSITVKIDNKSSTYGNDIVCLTASVTSGSIVNGDKNVYTLSTTATSISDVGTYKITGEVHNDNYAVRFINEKGEEGNGIYTINPRPITVEIADKSSVYGDGISNSTEGKGGLTVKYVDDSLKVVEKDESIYKFVTLTVMNGTEDITSSISSTNVGIYAITGVNIANSNYAVKFINENGEEGNGTYTINPRPITVEIADKSSVYGDGIIEFTVSIDSGCEMVGNDSIYSFVTLKVVDSLNNDITNAISITDVGTYYIVGEDNSISDNYNVTFINAGKATYTITKRAIKVTLDESKLRSVYGESVQDSATLYKSATIGDVVAKDNNTQLFTLQVVNSDDNSVTSTSNVGEYIIKISNINGNYKITTLNGNSVDENVLYTVENIYEITVRPVTVVINDVISVYGDGIEKLTVTQAALSTTNLGFVNDDVDGDKIYGFITLDVKNSASENITSVISTTNVGEYFIVGTNNNINYKVTFVSETGVEGSGTYTINKREITVTIGELTNVMESNNMIVVNATMSWNNQTLDSSKAEYVIKQGDVEVATIKNSEVMLASGKTVTAGSYTVHLKNYDDNNFRVTDFGSQNLTVIADNDRYSVTIVFDSDSKNKKEYDGKTVSINIDVKDKLNEKTEIDYTSKIIKDSSEVDNIKDVGIYYVEVTVGNTKYGTAVYEITKRPITVTIDNKTSVYGDFLALTAEVTSETQLVDGHKLYEGDSPVITLSCDGLKSTSDVGIYKITGSVNNTNYDVTFENGAYTINKRTVNVTINSAKSIYGEDCAKLYATVTEDSPYQLLESDNLATFITFAVMNGDTNITGAISTTNVGTYAIKGTNTNDNYDIVFDNNGTNLYTITQRPITVSFGTITKIYGDDVVTMDELFDKVSVSGTLATGDSKQDLFTLSVENGEQSITGVGNYNVVATNPNGNYEINFVTDFGIGKYVIIAKAITLVVTAGTSVYGDAIAKSIVELKDGFTLVGEDTLETLNGGYTISHDATQGSNVGTYQITAQDSNDEDNYKISFEFTNNVNYYTITPRPITITIGSGEKTYDGKEISSTDLQGMDVFQADKFASNWDGLIGTESDEVLTALRNALTLTVTDNAKDVKAGGYTVIGTFSHDNYEAKIINNGKYTINKRPITIEIGTGSKTYDGAVPDLSKISITINGTTITQTQVGAVNDDDKSALVSAVRNAFKLTGEDINAINAGSYVISSTFTGNDNYVVYTTEESNGYTNGTYTITPRTITVTIDNKSSTYGDGISNSSQGIDGLTVTVNKNSDQVLLGDNIYDFITLVVMNGTNKDITSSISSANVGTYYIVGTDKSSTDNYAVTFVNATDNTKDYGTYTITKRALTVTLGGSESVYGEDIKMSADLYELATIDNVVKKDKKTQLFELQVVDVRNGIAASTNNVGKYNIKISSINSNYKIATLNDNVVDEKESYTVEDFYTITKRQITVTIADQCSIYGESLAGFTAEVTSETKPVSGHNLYEGENAVITLSCDGLKSTSDVGTYQITGSVNNANYDVTFENGAYTINKRTVNVTINSAESIYGYGCATLSATVNDDSTYNMLSGHSLSDFITFAVMNGDDVITNDIATTNVGTYSIKGANVDNSNYDIVFDNNGANLYAITPRPITVSFGTITKTYGDDVVTNDELFDKVSVSGTLATGDSKQDLFTLSVENGEQSITGVGNYNVVATNPNGNYEINFVTDFGIGKYVITAKSITLVVIAGTSVYGDAIVNSTVALKDGFTLVGEDTLETLNGGYTISHDATQGSNVGTYQITAQDSNDEDNYKISFEFAKDKDSGKTVNYYTITERPVTYTVNSTTIYRYQDDWETLNGILNDEHFYGKVDNVVENETLKFTYKVIASIDESGATIYLTEENFDLQIRLGKFTIKATATDDLVNANYDITYVDGSLNVELPKVSVNADKITQKFTYSSDGIDLFNYADQIKGLIENDKLPTNNANAGSFKAELIDEQGNVVFEGTGTLSSVVPAGDYRLVISIVLIDMYYQWDEDVTTEYTITVKKQDISEFIISQGLNEYLQGNEKYQGWITNDRGGVYAEIADEKYENILVDSTVKFDGADVFELTQCGEYVLVATINDANYCGTQEFTFCVIQSVATEMGKLMTMSNEYSSKDDFTTRLSNINQMKAVVEQIKANTDYMLQVEQNKTYQTYIDKVDTLYNQLASDWTDYVNYNKQDVEIAKKVWQDTVAKAVATITLLGATVIVAKRRLGL